MRSYRAKKLPLRLKSKIDATSTWRAFKFNLLITLDNLINSEVMLQVDVFAWVGQNRSCGSFSLHRWRLMEDPEAVGG